MARRHKPDLEYVWRAVITHWYPSGAQYVLYAGPFAGKGHATAAAKRSQYHNASTEIAIQRSRLVWEDLEDPKGN